jgi:hypothetical protein
MGFFRWIFYLIRPYTDARERSVAKFFAGLNEHSAHSSAQSRLDQLLQENIAVINLWTEFRYKGYRYLTKTKRRELYAQLERITSEFELFYRAYTVEAETITARVRTIAPGARLHPNQTRLLQAIMDFLSPSNGRYEYRSSSSFGRMLRDPSEEVLVGDCNQIVTLYIYLYSRYFPVRDLHVRTLPSHVALHYGGVDIEATEGSWANYATQKDSVVLPIREIVSINLLDTTDENFATHAIDPEDFLHAARFAAMLSHEREIVTHNLAAAYQTIVAARMKKHDYVRALRFAKQSRDLELLAAVGVNGAQYHVARHDFVAARHFAEYAPKREEIIREIYRSEGVYHFDARRFHDAITAFKKLGDEKLVRVCYENLYVDEQNKLPKNLTSETIREHKRTVARMQGFARKSHNRQIIEQAHKLAKYL